MYNKKDLYDAFNNSKTKYFYCLVCLKLIKTIVFKLLMGGDSISENGFKPCWEYFKCSEESKKICTAYRVGKSEKNFKDCYFYVYNSVTGGPEKHGPCVNCEWNQKYGFQYL